MKKFKNLKIFLKEQSNISREIDFENARIIGTAIGVDWTKYDINQFVKGMVIELEHADVTLGNPFLTGKIVFAHLKELPDYYDRLEKIENKKKS